MALRPRRRNQTRNHPFGRYETSQKFSKEFAELIFRTRQRHRINQRQVLPGRERDGVPRDKRQPLLVPVHHRIQPDMRCYPLRNVEEGQNHQKNRNRPHTPTAGDEEGRKVLQPL